MNPLVLLMGSFFVMIILKIPVAFALALSSMVTIHYLGLSFISVINHMYSSVNSFTLLAVPFFLLLGQLMNDGGVTDRLVKLSDALVGHIRGGLGHINVMVSMLFAGLSGSAAADTAGIGAMLLPAMKKANYDVPYSAAVTAASSTLGVIIPPSIMMVIYGSVGQVSIGALFLAGFVPGVLIGLSQMGYTYYFAKKKGYLPTARKSLREMGVAFIRAIPPLILPIIILGGITGGVFTATEAAAVSVVYGLILMGIFYRSIKLKDMPRLLSEAVIGYSLPMLAVGSAGVMGWLIAYLNAPAMVLSFISGITQSPFGISLLIVAFLLIIGTFLSPITAIIIFLPIVQGLGNAAGIAPVHLGIIVVLTLSLGMVTPPYGICLLIASQIAEVPAPRVFMATLPLILLTLVIIVAGILMPGLFMFLPRLFMPQFL
ncbi:MAG: TRAP transporter large permease [Dethiobacter sp.]|jgi:tripartite ATP-independent transporter DctM subunit|nr:TRAP transporter large permease [Dethiobacter sp.]